VKIYSSRCFLSLSVIILLIVIGSLSGFAFFMNSSFHQLLYAQSSIHSEHTDNNTISKYITQENRIIKSLSSEDIESLETGTGDAFGGMAKLAELNGYPGPRHVLDLGKELGLTTAQKENITMIYNYMKREALKLGQEILQIEKTANELFDNKSISDSELQRLIKKSAENYGKLRYIHLTTHLKMMDILSQEQIILYNTLRGYNTTM
jgi:Spy/CpxP family protein refolding chaperone